MIWSRIDQIVWYMLGTPPFAVLALFYHTRNLICYVSRPLGRCSKSGDQPFEQKITESITNKHVHTPHNRTEFWAEAVVTAAYIRNRVVGDMVGDRVMCCELLNLFLLAAEIFATCCLNMRKYQYLYEGLRKGIWEYVYVVQRLIIS